MIHRLQSIDRRIIFLLLFLVVGYPLARPVGLPLPITSWAHNVYDLVQTLGAGDIVLLSVDYGTAMQADIHAQLVAVFSDLMRQNVRVIGVAFNPEGARFLSGFIALWEGKGKVYGVDFVDLGFVPGGETGLAGVAGDIVRTAPVDARGNDTSRLPLLRGVSDLSDTTMFLGFSAGVPGGREYVRQLPQYGVPLLVGCVTVSVTEYEPYVQSGQIAGLLGGLKGAAEYEFLSGQPGAALAGMDAQSAGHLLIILLVGLCNVGLLAEKSRRARGGGDNRGSV